MNSKYRFARRSASALAPCALLLAPLAAIAQDAKSADTKAAEAPAAVGDAYTLRLKFKQGDANRYKTTVKSTVTSPGGPGGATKTTVTDAASITEQKTIKLLDNGAAEIVITTLDTQITADGKPQSDTKAAPITTQVSPTAKVLSTKTADEDAGDAIKSLFTNSFSNPQSFLPDAAVKIGDKWTQKFTLPGLLSNKEGTMDCSLTRVETEGGVKTALIHAVMKVPMLIFLSAEGKPTKIEGDAMALFDGTVISNMDIHFAIDAGRVARMVSSGESDIAIKLGKAAPPEAAAFLPEGSKVTVKTSMSIGLLAPGEKAELPKLPKPADAKPETPSAK